MRRADFLVDRHSRTSAGEGEGWGALDEGCSRIMVALGKCISTEAWKKTVNGGTVAEEATVQGPHSATEEGQGAGEGGR